MTRLFRRIRATPVHLTVTLLTLAMVVGCGRVAGYPDTQVSSPLGREGICITCRKTIDVVGKQNLTTVDGIQFIVCSEACAEKAEDGAEHTH